LIPCSLELGGKNAMIVCHDADLDRAAAGGIAGNFFNAGQYCGGIERIYVVESVADDFIEKVVAIASKLRLNTEGEFDMGALYTEAQFETVKEHVDDARAKGAKVLCGGQPAPNLKGLYYEATVLTDVTTDMRSLAEETFGPVMNIIRVKDEEEALRLVNDSNYGLTGSVWTKDVARGVEIAKRIDTGSVDVNDFPQTYGTIEAPFGGRKASGIGQVNGPTGLRSYCHAMPVQVDRFGGKQTSGIFPRDSSQDDGFQKFIKFLWGTAAGRAISLMRMPS
jgi:succinate-semialdehyde dehydrogenase/glutarate-semialdehyde dehydrogenase